VGAEEGVFRSAVAVGERGDPEDLGSRGAPRRFFAWYVFFTDSGLGVMLWLVEEVLEEPLLEWAVKGRLIAARGGLA
jgi:hypothetical protein